MEKPLASLPLEGKVPAKRGNEVESFVFMLFRAGKLLLSTSSVVAAGLFLRRGIAASFPSRGSLRTTGI